VSQPAPLKGGALAVTALALALGTFMQVLDITIANVSLPTIAGNLGASTDQSTWIITSFVVANGIAMPPPTMSGANATKPRIPPVPVLNANGLLLSGRA